MLASEVVEFQTDASGNSRRVIVHRDGRGECVEVRQLAASAPPAPALATSLYACVETTRAEALGRIELVQTVIVDLALSPRAAIQVAERQRVKLWLGLVPADG